MRRAERCCADHGVARFAGARRLDLQPNRCRSWPVMVQVAFQLALCHGYLPKCSDSMAQLVSIRGSSEDGKRAGDETSQRSGCGTVAAP